MAAAAEAAAEAAAAEAAAAEAAAAAAVAAAAATAVAMCGKHATLYYKLEWPIPSVSRSGRLV